MSWASWALWVALVAAAVACSEQTQPDATATPTLTPPMELVFPTSIPVPAPRATPDDGCPVTQPNGQAPPGETPRTAHHGNGAIWTTLWPDGTVVFEPDGPGTRSDLDGSLSMKWPWWRADDGPLRIEGRRLDGEAGALHASIPDGYSFDFQATALIFPTPGCWEVTASAGRLPPLTFVTRVVSEYAPFARYEVGDVTLDSCPVTHANGVLPPGDDDALAYGNGGVSTYLWPGGKVVAGSDDATELRADGSLAAEWWWLRWTTGELEISGRRLDAVSGPLRAEVADAYGDGVLRSVLVFPEAGCWEVTGRMGDSGIVFITLVEGPG